MIKTGNAIPIDKFNDNGSYDEIELDDEDLLELLSNDDDKYDQSAEI